MSDKTSDKMSVELSDNFMNGAKAFIRILLFACGILVLIFATLLGVAGNHLALGCFLPAVRHTPQAVACIQRLTFLDHR